MFLLINLSCRNLLLVSLSVSVLIIPHNSQITYIYHKCYGPSTTADQAIQAINLTSFLDYLASKASLYNFYQDSSSNIYGLYLCRGDVSIETCQNCIIAAIQEIKSQCPYNQSAVIWYCYKQINK